MTLAERVAEKLGLPPSADDQTILEAVNTALAAKAARDVDQAIARGAISAAHRQVWLNSFKADADGTSAALASIVATVATTTYVPPLAARPQAPADPDALTDEQANDALWRLGCRAGLTPPRRWSVCLLTNPDGSAYVPGQPTP